MNISSIKYVVNKDGKDYFAVSIGKFSMIIEIVHQSFYEPYWKIYSNDMISLIEQALQLYEDEERYYEKNGHFQSNLTIHAQVENDMIFEDEIPF